MTDALPLPNFDGLVLMHGRATPLPDTAGDCYSWGLGFLHAGEPANARKAFAKAMRLDPTDTRSRLQLDHLDRKQTRE